MKKYIFYLLGFLISSLGILCFIKADVGAGTGDSVAIGLSLHIPITVGIGFALIHSSVVLLNSILSKKLPNPLVLLPIILRGLTVDLWIFVFDFLHIENIFISWGLLLFGIVLMGLGLGLYLQTDLPKIPVDDLMFNLSSINKLSFRVNRIFFETFFLIVGFLLGGPVGIGTAVIAFGLGPMIQFWDELFKRKTRQ